MDDVSYNPSRLYKEAVQDAAFSWYMVCLTEHKPLQRMRAVTSIISPCKVVAIPFDSFSSKCGTNLSELVGIAAAFSRRSCLLAVMLFSLLIPLDRLSVRSTRCFSCFKGSGALKKVK